MNENILKLEKIARDRFDYALLCDPGSEEAKTAFEEGKRAQDLANEMKKMEPNKDEKIFTIAMAVFTTVVAPVIVGTVKYYQVTQHTKRLCNFEKDYNFTTGPGKQASGLWKLW